MNNLLQKLMLGGSSAALLAAVPVQAFAQDIEQVVVSASRIQIAGYQQPTPVSVVGAAQLLEAAKADIGDTLRLMPQMASSATPEKGTNANAGNSGALGVSGINLRNLNANRTLVLVDGQRIASPILSGGVDLTVIPNTIVQRVDVVTGGASAAWGSDAVAGVVNIVINKNYSGLKGSLDFQTTGQDNRRSYGFTVTNGFELFGGRSHILWSINYNNSPQAVFASSAKWNNNPGLIANPLFVAGRRDVPQLIRVVGGSQNTTAGGNVLSGPLAGVGWGANGTLQTYKVPVCTYYTNANQPNATDSRFNYIATFTSNSNAYCYGGSATKQDSAQSIALLSFPLQIGTAFFHGTYKITPEIQASLMLNYGYNRNKSSSLTINETATIRTDNAYLNPTVLARMNAAGVTTIAVQSNMTDPINLSNPSLSDFTRSVGAPFTQTVRQFYRAAFSLDGAIGDNWSWNAYAQHSMSRLYQVYTAIEVKQNFLNAVDAVTVTAANQGKSGLAIGSIACRSTLTVPTNGCIPYNVMGTGVADPAAVRYILDNNDYYHLNIQQDTAGASMQGVLPWDLLGAGAPATAFGVEYRKESAVSIADPNGAIGALGGGNFIGIRGQYNVLEGFAQLDVPLIKNGIVNALDLSMAGRMTSYSTSGLVETWKLGLTSQLNDDIRLRFTMSVDIRAPNLGELYNTIPASGGQIDYKTGGNVATALSMASGSTNLVPETAITYSGGIVLTPHWIPGLNVAFDWYNINVKGVINAPSTTQSRNFCLAGTPTTTGGSYCANWIYGAPTNATNPNGLAYVYTYPTNNGFLTTSGLDFTADYAMDFMGGNLAWRLAGNYTDQTTQSIFGVTTASGQQASYNYAGSVGPAPFNGAPKMRMQAAATYTAGPWTGTVQTRYIGTAQLVNGWVSGIQVDDNRVPQVAYLDLRGTYRWNDNVQFYVSVDNVFHTPPPNTANYNPSTNGYWYRDYDILGRMWHAGVRFNF